MVANIGPRETRRRLLFGFGMLLVGFAGLAVLIAYGAPRVWRLALALPFWAGALGYFQARAHT